MFGGQQLVVGFPLTWFTAEIQAGGDLGEVVNKFTKMDRDTVETDGGFWAILGPGEGIVVPPAYLVATVNHDAILTGGEVEDVDSPSDSLAPSLQD